MRLGRVSVKIGIVLLQLFARDMVRFGLLEPGRLKKMDIRMFTRLFSLKTTNLRLFSMVEPGVFRKRETLNHCGHMDSSISRL
jgi:hypothetical protein